jgi:predicted nuclease of predicted toxin-antitoxin system
VRFLIDSMLPPRVAELLDVAGHAATTPTQIGAHNLPDDVLVQLAVADNRVIVTENASDFAAITTCPVLLIRKAWWPAASLAETFASALDRWAKANAEPGCWAHWLSAAHR